MKRVVFVFVLLVVASGVTTAQSPKPTKSAKATVQKAEAEPQPAAPAVAPPATGSAAPAPATLALDELDHAYLVVVALTEQIASSECNRLESAQRYQNTLADVVGKIEARHPGYTVDRAKGLLVAKPAPAGK